ncbi:MAG TPA: ATP-binding protein [Candidatus Limnocylindrales bacterium]|nr:ATP-binding protein [Candidatus Limnocylindrales bacterium]
MAGLSGYAMGGVFGGQVVAAAMIDRIVHHADVLPLKGASYRLRDRGIDTTPVLLSDEVGVTRLLARRV